MTTERFEVSREIAAAPSKVFAVLADPQGHVLIDSSGMLQSADGKPVEQVGDEFVVHMDRESLNDYPMGKYDVTVIITKFEPDALIEWTISGAIQPPRLRISSIIFSASSGVGTASLLSRKMSQKIAPLISMKNTSIYRMAVTTTWFCWRAKIK